MLSRHTRLLVGARCLCLAACSDSTTDPDTSNPTPGVSFLEPDPLIERTAGTLTIHGSDFVPTSVVRIEDAGQPTAPIRVTGTGFLHTSELLIGRAPRPIRRIAEDELEADHVLVHDANTFQHLATVDVPDARGSVGFLVRWGEDGLAFVDDGGLVVRRSPVFGS